MNNNNEKRVIRQLIAALLFEKIVEYQHANNTFEFNMGDHVYRACGAKGLFGRIYLESDSLEYLENDQWQPAVLTILTDDLPTPASIKQQLTLELGQTVSLCDWNAAHLPRQRSRRQLSYRELESALDEGHPYHPCFKARAGFTLKDHENYGPECGQTFQLHWLAFRRELIKQRLSPDSENNNDTLFWQRELGLSAWSQLQDRLVEAQGDWQSYSLMPIHPWQWDFLADKLHTPMACDQLLYLGAAGDYYQASISVRTLLNVSHPEKANIKLPLSIVNTSSLRLLEGHGITTAPILSHWLASILESDTYFQETRPLGMLAEYAGIRLADADTTETSWIKEVEGQLGVIFRESVEASYDGQSAVPVVALAVTENDQKPFIHDWIIHYGCEAWVRQLIEVCVIPIWHLLIHHGIAIEAHAQNLILIHQQGWPEKIIARDFHESLEYVPSFLADPVLAPDFTSLEPCYAEGKTNDYFWMDSLEALRELFVDTAFVFNLTELSILLQNHYDYEEIAFWRQVGLCLKAYEHSGCTAPERINMVDLYQPAISAESLLTKKLSGKKADIFHHLITNPLASINV